MFRFIRRHFSYAIIDNIVIPDALWIIRINQKYNNKFIYDIFDMQILVSTYVDPNTVELVETLERLDILNIILKCYFGFRFEPDLNNGELRFLYVVSDKNKLNNYDKQHLNYQYLHYSQQKKMKTLITTIIFLFLV